MKYETERRELGTWALCMCASEALQLQAECAWNGSQGEKWAGSSLLLSVPESAAMQHKRSDPKARVLNLVIFCVNSSKPCSFLYVFVFLFEYVIF